MVQTFALLVSVLVSVAWLAGSGAYIDGHIGWENLLRQHPSELAALMAGIFAPLALLWLLIAYFRQASAQRDLAFALTQLHWQARKSAEQTETIVRALSEGQNHERHAQALTVFDRGLSDLQSLGVRLILGFGRMAPRDLPGLWRMTQSGDRFAIFRSLLGDESRLDETKRELAARLVQSPSLRPLIADFVQLHEQLAEFVIKQSVAPLLREGFEHGPPAKLQALLLSVLRAEPAMPPSEQRPPPAEFANPSAAMLANKVAKVLWPQGSEPQTPLPAQTYATNTLERMAARPALQSIEDSGPPPSEPTVSSATASGNVMPFSPLAPGFPRNPGP